MIQRAGARGKLRGRTGISTPAEPHRRDSCADAARPARHSPCSGGSHLIMWTNHEFDDIPGTYVFDGRRAVLGYAVNRMCMSFNSDENRQAFQRDEDGYCRRYGLSDAQRQAVRERDILQLVKLGGNIYYLAKLAGIFHLNVQDIGAQQTGMSVDEFKAKLVAAGA
jgi:protocatechuate 4,5-dioxygenase alpha chain